VAGRPRAIAALVPALALIGCGGGGEDAVDERAVRACLAEQGLGIEAITSSPAPGGAAADFRALAGDVSVDVVVERDEARAQRTGAGLRGALSTLGVADVEQRVLEEGNAVAVFSATPEPELRDAVAGCLG
jgi:hypothetical protein